MVHPISPDGRVLRLKHPHATIVRRARLSNRCSAMMPSGGTFLFRVPFRHFDLDFHFLRNGFLWHRYRELEHAIVIGGLQIIGFDSFGQSDRTFEGTVSDLTMQIVGLLSLALFFPRALDRQHVAHNLDIDVLGSIPGKSVQTINFPSSTRDSIAGRSVLVCQSANRSRPGKRPNQSRSKPKRSSRSSNSLRKRSSSLDGLHFSSNPIVASLLVYILSACMRYEVGGFVVSWVKQALSNMRAKADSSPSKTMRIRDVSIRDICIHLLFRMASGKPVVA